ncbi:hypothetical protein AYI70_g11716 [Smittium culicis]|uniref:Uncharacterized protein n=1 Tax=Smittium culicis TaxID=133412 RepID=A0A1R1X0L3_9FUNG|nr:hypothetical protein AYI70_g11716 [Smittium culicis]
MDLLTQTARTLDLSQLLIFHTPFTVATAIQSSRADSAGDSGLSFRNDEIYEQLSEEDATPIEIDNNFLRA